MNEERLKHLLNRPADAVFERLDYTSRMARDAKREAWWWVKARADALSARRGLVVGSTIVWTETGRAELLRREVPRPGPGHVLVKVQSSAVSPGTEKAQYLRLPNADVSFPRAPGFSAAGTVLEVGAGVQALSAGDPVAVSGVPHASVVTASAASAYTVPPGVSLEAASFVHLGIIARLGLLRSELGLGDPVCVLGSGLIGLLVQRLAAGSGAGETVVVAASRAKEQAALAGGASRFLVAGEDDEEIASLGARVVVDASGGPGGIRTALSALGDGGRIVLLGSPRGITREFPLDDVQSKRARLVGAHVSMLGGDAGDARRREADGFLASLARDPGLLDDLTLNAVDPREADAFYRALSRDRSLVAARFDWTRLPAEERYATSSFVRLPDLRARGLEQDRKPLPAPLAGREGRESDPFEEAVGRLRVGLLGCGDVAGQNAAAIVAAPNTELVACFDPVASLADDIGRRFGAETTTSAESLLERSDVDCVFIAAPHHLHAPLAIQAIERGCHVVVEKPLANDLESGESIVRAAREAGVHLSVCFPMRYHPVVRAARRLVDEGALGGFLGALVTYRIDKPASYWVGGFSGRSASHWRTSRELAGGGVLIMNLSHFVDLVRHLSGEEVEAVTALTAAEHPDSEVEDSITIGARHTAGGLATYAGSSAVRGTRESSIDLWGRDGRLAIQPRGRVFTLRNVDGLAAGRWHELEASPSGDSRAIFMSRFATAVHHGVDPDVTADDGLAVQTFIDAAYRSAEEGRTIELTELVPGVAH